MSIGIKKRISLFLVIVFAAVLMSFPITGSAYGDRDVALEKPATCEGSSEGHEASAANDRSPATYWEGLSCPAWWEVDLGAFYDISRIKIATGEGMSCSGKDQGYCQYTIYSSPDNAHWTKVAEKQDTKPSKGFGETYGVSTTWVKYLKVNMTYDSEDTGVRIRDFKAYGRPSKSKGLGIGDSGLSETRITYPVARGVTRTLIMRGYMSGSDINASTTGPWQVNVLTIDPKKYRGTIKARLCGGLVTTRATVLEEAVSQGATAAVNASYFVLYPFWGSVGASMSLFAADGKVTNEAVNPRSGLFIPNGTLKGIRMGRFTSAQTATSSDGSSITINGLNRKPGVKMGVGANYTPFHDNITYFPDEVVLYTGIFGPSSESVNGAGNSNGAEAVLDAGGVVTGLYDTLGHAIPAGGKILAGTGTGAAWVLEHAKVGNTIKTAVSVTFEGKPLKLGPKAGIVSAGPCLVKNGKKTTSDYWAEEGFSNAGFIGRNPRTLVGTKPDGTLLIAVVDGRLIDLSVGATFDECANIMMSLGATNVLNLDGGRSSIMTVGDKIVNNVLEKRAVGDILELLP